MQHTITINDTLSERFKTLCEEIKDKYFDYLSKGMDSANIHSVFDLGIHELVDGNVPIYTSEIKDLWYLHGSEFEEAYENAGVGENPLENDGRTAIYYYLEQQSAEWFRNNEEDLFDEWQNTKDNTEDC